MLRRESIKQISRENENFWVEKQSRKKESDLNPRKDAEFKMAALHPEFSKISSVYLASI